MSDSMLTMAEAFIARAKQDRSLAHACQEQNHEAKITELSLQLRETQALIGDLRDRLVERQQQLNTAMQELNRRELRRFPQKPSIATFSTVDLLAEVGRRAGINVVPANEE